MSAYKIDLRWPAAQRFTDRTETPDPELALAAFRRLLARTDLDGEDVAARLVVPIGNGSRSLYYSNFRKPVGRGRIHPDAPLRLEGVTPEEADALARWLPSVAARPGGGGRPDSARAAGAGAPAAAAAGEAAPLPLPSGATAQLVAWLAMLARAEPAAFRKLLDDATHESAERVRNGGGDDEAWVDGERARAVLLRAARAAGW